MSDALFGFGGLRFWTEDEIELREWFQARAVAVVKRTLTGMNPAWRYFRTEGPCLTPRSMISNAYDANDIFVTTHEKGGETLCLRAETTVSSYAVAKRIPGKLPICVWQAGKSFRTETNDGASAAKLRFNEFWQLEFQCVYRVGTGADYRTPLMAAVADEIERFTGLHSRQITSDRIPAYSESTEDIEVKLEDGKWREMASCSIRNDFSEDTRVCEIAIGLDRVATLAAQYGRLL